MADKPQDKNLVPGMIPQNPAPFTEDSQGRIKYFVSYVIYGDDGVKNITPGPAEYLELGDLEFTYDEDTDFEALVRGRRVQ